MAITSEPEGFRILKDAVDGDQKKLLIDAITMEMKKDDISQEEITRLANDATLLGKEVLPSILYNVISNLSYALSEKLAESSLHSSEGDQAAVIPDFWSWIANIQNYFASISTWQKKIQECITSELNTDFLKFKEAVKMVPAPINPPAAGPVSIVSNLFFKESESK